MLLRHDACCGGEGATCQEVRSLSKSKHGFVMRCRKRDGLDVRGSEWELVDGGVFVGRSAVRVGHGDLALSLVLLL